MGNPDTLPAPPPLAELVRERGVSLFLDFDGTLVELAPTPDGITVPVDLARQLYTLSTRLDHRFALVSGRSLDDLEGHLGTLSFARAGSHGASRILGDGTRLGEVPTALPEQVGQALEAFAREHGLIHEAKAHGAALHFRDRPDLQERVHDFARGLARDHSLDVKHGKCVAELVQPGATKAGAVDVFMEIEPFASTIPIFVGDDVTDEDGFRAATALGGFGIAVGERPSANARYHLDTVQDVYEWLKL